LGKKAYLIDNAEQMRQEWLSGVEKVGFTAGASAPEILVQQVVSRLKEWGGDATAMSENTGIEEKVVFSLPKELRN
ncbi:MAG TPA: 4-hydroxy-3-methylbut-2-enyl diphosphate reductase, partial [Methylococcaceae bacterium]|nr:4-hydroxy-3-methylbut-2-enyl diphosphate reductase [Methylococcaceae bacterium]